MPIVIYSTLKPAFAAWIPARSMAGRSGHWSLPPIDSIAQFPVLPTWRCLLVIGVFLVQVSMDLVVAQQRPEADFGADVSGTGCVVARVVQCQRGMKGDCPPTHLLQLGHCPFVCVPGLPICCRPVANWSRSQRSVPPDSWAPVRVPWLRASLSAVSSRPFAGRWGFVDIWRGCLERDGQTLQ